MANWKLPYSIPKFTSEEFEKMRAEYIGKYGYTIYVPGWEDIVHLPLEHSFTEQEEVRWAAKDWDFFSPLRLEELKAIKERRRKMYLRLLGSPQPRILRNRGSILVALDNNQDALSTLSMIIRIAYTVVPLVWKRLLTGPVGWIMTASDILNLCTYVMTPERSAIRTKRIKDAITDKNPFSRKARLKRSMKLFREKIGSGTIIEALQTTDQVFGYGISLGAIMNLPFDMAAGSVRRLDGSQVTMITPDSQPRFWSTQAATAWKSLTTLFTTEKIFDVAEALPMLIASHLMAVAVHVALPTMDPKNEIINLDQYMVKALEPKKSYLREVMEEAGDDPDGFTGWPVTNTPSASCTEIAGKGYPTATRNFRDWCFSNRKSLEAFYGAQRAVDAAHYMLASISDDESVEYDYIAAEKATHSLLNAGYRFPYYLTTPSGFYTQETDYNYEDVHEKVITKAEAGHQRLLFELIGHPKPWTEAEITQAEKLMGTKSSGYASTQIRMFTPKPIWPIGEFKYVDNLRTRVIANTKTYLQDHETNGSTPSTPGFIKWLEENMFVKLPVNETVETPP